MNIIDVHLKKKYNEIMHTKQCYSNNIQIKLFSYSNGRNKSKYSRGTLSHSTFLEVGNLKHL